MVESTHAQAQNETDTAWADIPSIGDISCEWHWVKEGVEEILRDTPHLTYTADDVYRMCEEGQAILWVTEKWFVISTEEVDEFTGKRTFLLWLAWAKERGAKSGIIGTRFFEEAAKYAGFSSLEIRTSVPSIVEYLQDTGWHLDTLVLSRQL